jgi:hypothetical protein
MQETRPDPMFMFTMFMFITEEIISKDTFKHLPLYPLPSRVRVCAFSYELISKWTSTPQLRTSRTGFAGVTAMRATPNQESKLCG